jgi:hypothetical protein
MVSISASSRPLVGLTASHPISQHEHCAPWFRRQAGSLMWTSLRRLALQVRKYERSKSGTEQIYLFRLSAFVSKPLKKIARYTADFLAVDKEMIRWRLALTCVMIGRGGDERTSYHVADDLSLHSPSWQMFTPPHTCQPRRNLRHLHDYPRFSLNIRCLPYD